MIDIYDHQIPLKRYGRTVTDDDINLPVSISEFSHTLTKLFIHSHTADISLTLLLDYLPALTHLSVTFEYKAHNSLHSTESIDSNTSPRNSIKNLIYLRLDNTFNFDRRICPVLYRCPNLRFLMIPSDIRQDEIRDLPTQCLYTALHICPRINYILMNVEPLEGSQMKQWLQLSKKQIHWNDGDKKDIIAKMIDDQQEKEGVKLVRGFVFGATDQDELTKTFPLLENSRSWLEYLRIECINTGLNDLLTKKIFPQLKALEIFGLLFTSEEWIDILHGHPQLEHLETELWFQASEELDSVIEVIGKLERLKRLVLYCPTISTLPEIVSKKIYLLCRSRNQLETLELPGFPVSDKDLLCLLVGLPKLRALYLSGSNQTLTEDGLIAFANRLRKKEKSMMGTIQCLDLHNIEGVTNKVLEHLGMIENLTVLRITSNKNISDTGIAAYFGLQNNSSRVHKKKKVEVDRCPGISKKNTLVSPF
ncbi:hypothetical protein INT45_000304 [Circinella minor]|uniref:Uncharacterized protein n=1 Tax=Circinella minor TaxID=1195481 RepID=A0A8H7VPR3_9FUNG|nr:hypothetical protein INT45_000304 [Circinella minor]